MVRSVSPSDGARGAGVVVRLKISNIVLKSSTNAGII